MANSNLCLAMMACLSQRALAAAVDAGCLSKSDVAVINSLRAGGGGIHGADIAKRKLVGAVRKQFAERDLVRKAIEAYARDAVKKETEMTTDRVVAGRVEKARTEQKIYSDLIKAYRREHPTANKSDAIDAVLFGATAKRLVELDREIDAVAKIGITRNDGTLPQQRPGTMLRTHNDAPVRGETGYDASVADTHPRNQDAGENPIIRDHHQTLADIAAGRINESDPKFKALRALEMKRLYRQA